VKDKEYGGSRVRIPKPLWLNIAVIGLTQNSMSTFEDVETDTDLDRLSSEARRIIEAVKRQDKEVGLDRKPNIKKDW